MLWLLLQLVQPQPQATEQTSSTEKHNQTAIRKPKKLIIHHRFEAVPLTKFSHQFKKIWHKHFCYEQSKLNNVRLIIATISNPSLERLLVKKKPSHALLRKMNDTNETTNTTKAESTNK